MTCPLCWPFPSEKEQHSRWGLGKFEPPWPRSNNNPCFGVVSYDQKTCWTVWTSLEMLVNTVLRAASPSIDTEETWAGFSSSWLIGGLEHFLFSISYMGCHPSHWLFFRGVGMPPTSWYIVVPRIAGKWMSHPTGPDWGNHVLAKLIEVLPSTRLVCIVELRLKVVGARRMKKKMTIIGQMLRLLT